MSLDLYNTGTYNFATGQMSPAQNYTPTPAGTYDLNPNDSIGSTVNANAGDSIDVEAYINKLTQSIPDFSTRFTELSTKHDDDAPDTSSSSTDNAGDLPLVEPDYASEDARAGLLSKDQLAELPSGPEESVWGSVWDFIKKVWNGWGDTKANADFRNAAALSFIKGMFSYDQMKAQKAYYSAAAEAQRANAEATRTATDINEWKRKIADEQRHIPSKVQVGGLINYRPLTATPIQQRIQG